MSSSPYLCDDARLGEILSAEGVFRFGVAKAEPVDENARRLYRDWVAEGNNAEMDYLDRYDDVRSDPRLLLEGARSLIVCAFPYSRPVQPEPGCLRIASYALGDDYHDVLRRRLKRAAAEIDSICGSQSRVCVDTAPLRERYWAVRSGLGFIGLNCQLILPGVGSYFFLATIVTTAELKPHEPCRLNCASCRRCIAYCPAAALSTNPLPHVDARKCLSCLTIEHRGPFADPQPHLGDRLYGCDTCQIVCPHNRPLPGDSLPEPLPEFRPRPELLRLTKDRVLNMTDEEYAALTRHSAMRRCSLADLRRNARLTTV